MLQHFWMDYNIYKTIDFAWCEVMAVTMNGVWKNLCLQCVFTIFMDLKVDKESKEVFSNLVIFSEKLELDLQEDETSLHSLLCNMRCLLMKT